MSLTSAFRRTDIASDPGARPAAAALAALRKRLADLIAQRESWADREQRALADVRAHDAAIAERQRLEEQRIDLLAQVEISGGVPLTLAELEQRLEEARARELRLTERRRVAEKVIAHIRTEYDRIRAEQIDASRQYIAHQHAAAVERLRDLAPAFLHAESQYLAMLEKICGTARCINRLTDEQRAAGLPQLGQVGDLNTRRDLNMWRPDDPEFNPVPQRDAIHNAIEAEAARLREELK